MRRDLGTRGNDREPFLSHDSMCAFPSQRDSGKQNGQANELSNKRSSTQITNDFVRVGEQLHERDFLD